MFPFTDPTGTGLLTRANAITAFRNLVANFDRRFGMTARSSYVERDAFSELSGGETPEVNTVTWLAFPRTATVPHAQIDADRLRWQDEYVEWRVEKDNAGRLVRVTFTTEFIEYYEALAMAASLGRGVREAIPGANPTAVELYGPNFNPNTATPRARAQRFRAHIPNNPWNNGRKGILFLAQQFNTLSALYNLVGECAVRRDDVDPGAVCANVGGACGPARNSDPRICLACQNLAQAERGLSLNDPVGIRIMELGSVWKINGQAIDINDAAQNRGAWKLLRNGRRAVLDVTKAPGLTLGDDPVTTGAQVAAVLTVGADVISATETALPEWARTGNEGTRGGNQ